MITGISSTHNPATTNNLLPVNTNNNPGYMDKVFVADEVPVSISAQLPTDTQETSLNQPSSKEMSYLQKIKLISASASFTSRLDRPKAEHLTLDLANDNIEQWVADNVEARGWTHGKTFVSITTTPDHIDRYQMLQQTIAKKIPIEGKRPVVHVQFIGQASQGNNSKTIGILGGTGPLSDASITQEVIHSLGDEAQQHSIDLLSIPPPRAGGLSRAPHMPVQLKNYVATMQKFLQDTRATDFYLASNTAHNHIDVVQAMVAEAEQSQTNNSSPSQLLLKVGLKTLQGQKPVNKTLHNLVDQTASHVKAQMQTQTLPAGHQPKVLAMTTKVAWKAQLYPQAFDKLAMESTAPDATIIDDVQDIVDQAKGNTMKTTDPALNKRNAKASFLNIIKQQITASFKQAQPINSVLLGCTDFALLADDNSTIQQEVEQFLQAEFPKHPLTVFDTDEIYAAKICEQIRS